MNAQVEARFPGSQVSLAWKIPGYVITIPNRSASFRHQNQESGRFSGLGPARFDNILRRKKRVGGKARETWQEPKPRKESGKGVGQHGWLRCDKVAESSS